MITIQPYRQKKDMCGPAALFMVARYYGISTTVPVLARFSGWSPKKGTSAQGLVNAAERINMVARVKDRATLRELKHWVKEKKVPVIVDWFSHDDGHYSVVVDIDNQFVWLQDPEIGGLRKIDLDFFRRVWFDFPGPYIRKRDQVIVRRMIIVRPKKAQQKIS